MWIAPEHPLLQNLSASRARLRFAATPMMIIDALAFLPLVLELLFPQRTKRAPDPARTISEARVLFAGPRSIGRVLAAERRALLACVIIISGVMLMMAATMQAVEGEIQPDRLGDMSKAMWWSAAMLAKIGGIELTPITPPATLSRPSSSCSASSASHYP